MFRGAVSPERYVRLAQWALWLNAAIVLTGASVRLTGSGLGCTDWPTCEEDQFVASLEYHALIEFGNRLFTGAVGFAVMIAVRYMLSSVWSHTVLYCMTMMCATVGCVWGNLGLDDLLVYEYSALE